MRSFIGIVWFLATLLTSLSFVNASGPTTSDKPGFIKASGKKFTLDGKPFRYIGTNAYWLQVLNKKDLNKTMHDISALGVKVVRTWAFNDVTKIPKKGVWFQVFHKNGTIEINKGDDGLVRLDNIVQAAKDNKLHIVFALTNNWFRGATADDSHQHGHGHDDHKHGDDDHKHGDDGHKHGDDDHKHGDDGYKHGDDGYKHGDDGYKHDDDGDKRKQKNSKRGNHTTTTVDRRHLPRNFLSNDYGGMDVYCKHFSNGDSDIFHDDFYTNSDIVDAYSRYVAKIVKRYAHEPAVLGWEIANDPRCSSGLPSSGSCTPQTITQWTATMAAVVKEHDPNHLVSVGDGGFYCVGCPKLFPRESSERPPKTKHPKEKEPKHPEEKEPKHPKEKEPKHPKEKEPKDPKEKEPKDPKEKEPKDPKEKEPKDPKEKEPKDPKEKEPKDPKEKEPEKESKDPKEKEEKDPKEKESKDPKEDYRRRGYLTEADLHKLFAKRAKRSLDVRGGHEKDKSRHCKTRGHGYAARGEDHKYPDHKHPDHKHPDHKNQSHTFGPIFDGSFGIDAEDLANAPGIDFTTLQYYPDQTTFGPDGDIDLSDPRNIAQNGVDWVKLHAKTGKTFGKPVAVTAFGVLTDKSRKKFVPFNPNDEGNDFTTCTTPEDRADIFDAVFGAGIKAGVNVQQYQWGQRNLTSTRHGSGRRQDPGEEDSVDTSYDDGYAEYDGDPGRGSIAGAAHDMSAGESDDGE